MIVDIDQAAALPPAARYDVCIAGGGVAGITLAHRLAGQGRRVLLLEAGGLEYSDQSQSFYSGANIGYDYFDLDFGRLRFLGGTSNHWSGRCRPLDARDFERHAHVEGSGWPIGISDLEPYVEEARDIVEIPEFPPDVELEGSDGLLKEIYFHRGKENDPVRFGEKYRDFLTSSEAVDVFLNANLVDIELDSDSGRVAAFLFRGYKETASLQRAVADRYVLALGGIETPRMLLNARSQMPQGIGNESDLVGRYFMEHPSWDVGYYVLTSETTGYGSKMRWLAPTEKLIQQEGIGNVSYDLEVLGGPPAEGVARSAKAWARRAVCNSEVLIDWVRSMERFKCRRRISDAAGLLWVHSEQVPNSNSRVTLSEETDAFGLRKVALDWQPMPQDRKTISTVAMEIAKYMARTDIARVKLLDWVLDEDDQEFPNTGHKGYMGGHHHMGTTRMGFSKQDGVVDENCRVFGVDNLYISSSSIFRTGGHANPTFTIVQFALRLADHLART